MKPSFPIHSDVVLVGGGHSHVAVLKSFGMRPEPGVRLTLIARDVLTPYSGMLPGLIAGHYTHEQAHVDLQRLCRFANARLFHATASGIDVESRTVHCTGRPPVVFDWLSLDIGSTPKISTIRGAAEYALAIKPVHKFLAAWPEIERQVVERAGDIDIVTIGAGAGGVELTLSLQHRLHGVLSAQGIHRDPRFHIISESADILPTHAPKVRGKLQRMLEKRSITLHRSERAQAVTHDAVELVGGSRIAADITIAVTDAGAPDWLRASTLALDREGFVQVDRTLRAHGTERVFATGDIASFSEHPLPKSGVYAVRQGPVLADNLRRVCQGKQPRPYRPQTQTLALISTGNPSAVASYGPSCFEGGWVWRIKDWIDRRWMEKYQELPRMDGAQAEPTLGNHEATSDGSSSAFASSAFAMRCGGCGSKVASPVLRRVLDQLGKPSHPDVLVGLERSDDAAVLDIPADRLLVQSVDHFRPFIDDPYIFARITTNHCLSDLFAMGASPHTAQAMVSVPFAREAQVEQELLALLTGVNEGMAEAGAVLVGGHTAEGPELSLGLAVNGLVRRDRFLTKHGMAPGDQLILTKPLGTGVIFAADMRVKAGAQVVGNALAQMLQSNQKAAECILQHGARACTDVTGFGLAGHLVEMLRASALDASLDFASIPVLSGASELFATGLRSSLHPGNATFLERVEANGASDDDLATLLDPQTSGGLLASVPNQRAQACLAALHSLGFSSSRIIGEAQPVPISELPLAGRIRIS